MNLKNPPMSNAIPAVNKPYTALLVKNPTAIDVRMVPDRRRVFAEYNILKVVAGDGFEPPISLSPR